MRQKPALDVYNAQSNKKERERKEECFFCLKITPAIISKVTDRRCPPQIDTQNSKARIKKENNMGRA